MVVRWHLEPVMQRRDGALCWHNRAAVFARVRGLVVWTLCLLAMRTGAQDFQSLQADHDTQGEAVLQAFVPVVAEARASVVSVWVDDRPVALGAIIDAGGWVITKASELEGRDSEHLIKSQQEPAMPEEQEPRLSVKLMDGRTVDAEVAAVDKLSDLALLRISAVSLTPLRLTDDGPLKLGQWVVVPGIDALPEAVGVVSVLPRPINGVRLGVSLLDTGAGPMIGQTLEGMGADEAGVEPGDVVKSLDGQPTPDSRALIAAVQGLGAGDTVPMVVERKGKPLELEVELRLRPLDERSRTDHMNSMGNGVSRRRDGFASVLQHDASIEPDHCGGPLLDLEGRCVGINIARAGRVESYALPTSIVIERLAILRERAAQNAAEKVHADTEPATTPR